MATNALRPRKIRKRGKTKTARTSVSIESDLRDMALKRADERHGGNLSVYLTSLIQRDLNEQLWIGTATDPKNEKVIDALCATWTHSDSKRISKLIQNVDQPRLLRLLITALEEFAQICDGLENLEHESGYMRKISEISIMPKDARDSIWNTIKMCTEHMEKSSAIPPARMIPFLEGRHVWLRGPECVEEMIQDRDYASEENDRCNIAMGEYAQQMQRLEELATDPGFCI